MREMAARGGDGYVTEGLTRKADVFMRIAVAARLRSRIYNETSKLRRMLMIARAGRLGIYEARLGMYGFRSVAKDFAAALLPRERWLD